MSFWKSQHPGDRKKHQRRSNPITSHRIDNSSHGKTLHSRIFRQNFAERLRGANWPRIFASRKFHSYASFDCSALQPLGPLRRRNRRRFKLIERESGHIWIRTQFFVSPLLANSILFLLPYLAFLALSSSSLPGGELVVHVAETSISGEMLARLPSRRAFAAATASHMVEVDPEFGTSR